MKRLKILASAYACEPGKGSEPGVGWNYAIEMAKHHNLWVLTRANNQQAIEAELEKNPVGNLNFIYFDLSSTLRKMKNAIPGGVSLYYFLWQRAARKVVADAQSQIGFDVAQHVTFAQYWMPCALQDSGIPYVYGPVGGGEYVPKQYLRGLSLKGRFREPFRRAMQSLFGRLPCVKRACANASIVIAATDLTANACRRLGARRIELCSQVGIDKRILDSVAHKPSACNPDHQAVFACIGRLIDWKGFWIAAEAFCRADIPNSRMIFTAGGEDEARIKQIFGRHGMADRAEFCGWVPPERLSDIMASMTALVFPSMRDSSGMVIVEALAHQKPVICFDWAGPGFITRGCAGAHQIRIGTLEETIAAYAESMKQLSKAPANIKENSPLDISRFFFTENVGLYCRTLDSLSRKSEVSDARAKSE